MVEKTSFNFFFQISTNIFLIFYVYIQLPFGNIMRKKTELLWNIFVLYRISWFKTQRNIFWNYLNFVLFADFLTWYIMPESTLRDINNNRIAKYPNTLKEHRNPPGNGPKNIQVKAKILFGSVIAIDNLKNQEKLAKQNKKAKVCTNFWESDTVWQKFSLINQDINFNKTSMFLHSSKR